MINPLSTNAETLPMNHIILCIHYTPFCHELPLTAHS